LKSLLILIWLIVFYMLFSLHGSLSVPFLSFISIGSDGGTLIRLETKSQDSIHLFLIMIINIEEHYSRIPPKEKQHFIKKQFEYADIYFLLGETFFNCNS